MKSYAIALSLLLTAGTVIGQTGKQTVDTHVAAAKAAARQEHTSLLNLCSAAEPAPPAPQGQRAAAQPQGPPDRSQWHAEPVKVFDNLYFVGMTEYSSWAVNTSDGIIVVDAIFDYSVEDEIAKGLPKLGLDPKKIKYLIVSHGHIDHAGGAKYLQDHFGAHSHYGWPGLGSARSRSGRLAETKTRHGCNRSPATHSRRHDADAVSDARPHARHDFDTDSNEGWREAARCGAMGRYRVQLAPKPDNLHNTGSAGPVLVRDL